MSDLAVSIAVLLTIVLLSEAMRRAAARFIGDYWRINAVEAASTFQLCACSRELKLLGEVGGVEPRVGLTTSYIITVINVLTSRGASCNPTGTLENACRRYISARGAAALIVCQFLGASAARLFALSVWTLGLSDLHVKHERFGFKCFDPINGTLVEAAAVELACAFAVQGACMHIRKLDEKFRAYAIAAVITFFGYAGGGISGGIFNPVLAFSIQFPCSGHSFLEYCFVYWLGPLLGAASCILFFEKVIPFLSRKTTVGLDVPVVQKKKTQ